jgi:hypothetical protein
MNPSKHEHTDNNHQKTVSGQNQHGPADKVGRDAGGNANSKGQNIDPRNARGTGQEPGDIGDERQGGER